MKVDSGKTWPNIRNWLTFVEPLVDVRPKA